jgi:hypothetical protein
MKERIEQLKKEFRERSGTGSSHAAGVGGSSGGTSAGTTSPRGAHLKSKAGSSPRGRGGRQAYHKD